MELLYVLYKPSGKQSKYLLLLPLGSRGGKLCAILTSTVSDGEIKQIKASLKRLSSVSLERKIEWIKNNIPHAYKKGFREIWEKNYQVVSRHPTT